MPLHFSSTCGHHQEVKTALHSLWYHHTYSCDDTRGCVMHFWPPDDEHMYSKYVEAWNKLIVKQKLCASSWLITEINKEVNTLMDPCIRLHPRFPVVTLKHGDDLRLRCCWIYRCGSLRYLTGIVFFHLICHANDKASYTGVARNSKYQHCARPYVTGEDGGLAFNIWAGN